MAAPSPSHMAVYQEYRFNVFIFEIPNWVFFSVVAVSVLIMACLLIWIWRRGKRPPPLPPTRG
jgi:hypothetical protein